MSYHLGELAFHRMADVMENDPWILRFFVLGSGVSLLACIVAIFVLSFCEKPVPAALIGLAGMIFGFISTLAANVLGFARGRESGQAAASQQHHSGSGV